MLLVNVLVGSLVVAAASAEIRHPLQQLHPNPSPVIDKSGRKLVPRGIDDDRGRDPNNNVAIGDASSGSKSGKKKCRRPRNYIVTITEHAISTTTIIGVAPTDHVQQCLATPVLAQLPRMAQLAQSQDPIVSPTAAPTNAAMLPAETPTPRDQLSVPESMILLPLLADLHPAPETVAVTVDVDDAAAAAAAVPASAANADAISVSLSATAIVKHDASISSPDIIMSPRPSSFVKREGSKLMLDGEAYRMVGPNIYWLALDDNIGGVTAYPSKGRVREAMAIAVAMGANTVRSHTLGISTGHALSVMPSRGYINQGAFEAIDYAIWAARNYGLRLFIPLTDEHSYYHGGLMHFVDWAGQSEPLAFFENRDCIDQFKFYIKSLLNHVNQFTGVAYKDDPTILGWETANEFGGWRLSNGVVPTAAWTAEIALLIKSLAPNHLVADGTHGFEDQAGNLLHTGLQIDQVDMISNHYYPLQNSQLDRDVSILSGIEKNFFVGEFDWTGKKGGDSVDSFYARMESLDSAGSMMWSIFGRDNQCDHPVHHNDGYTLEYPSGAENDAQPTQELKLAQHWYRMRKLTPPTALPAVACPQPELLP